MQKKNTVEGREKIKHFEDPKKKGHYICNNAVGIRDAHKMSRDWKEITCRNCLKLKPIEKVEISFPHSGGVVMNSSSPEAMEKFTAWQYTLAQAYMFDEVYNLAKHFRNEFHKNMRAVKKKEEAKGRKIIGKYVYAYDPKINKRVVHVVNKGYAISMVTGHKFRYDPEKNKAKEKPKKRGKYGA